ncbi:MAG: hypothetical protein QOD82_6705, partial [Pseudonocardiales bacterium]|nr:hypothetical protein [Pseudonocardiales bacterium]
MYNPCDLRIVPGLRRSRPLGAAADRAQELLAEPVEIGIELVAADAEATTRLGGGEAENRERPGGHQREPPAGGAGNAMAAGLDLVGTYLKIACASSPAARPDGRPGVR